MKKMLAFFSWVPGKVAAGRKGGIKNQHLSRLAVSTSTMTLRRKKNVETLPATSQKTRSPWLSRLAAAREPSVYPAWRLSERHGVLWPTIYMMHIADGNPPDDKYLTHRNSGAIRRRNHDRYRHDGIFSQSKNDTFSPPILITLFILTILFILNRWIPYSTNILDKDLLIATIHI